MIFSQRSYPTTYLYIPILLHTNVHKHVFVYITYGPDHLLYQIIKLDKEHYIGNLKYLWTYGSIFIIWNPNFDFI